MKKKRCTKCKKTKPLNEIGRDRSKKNGYGSQCKNCKSKQIRERISNDPEYHKKVNKQKREYAKKRRAEDPEFRKLLNKRNRECKRRRMKNDPLYREQTNKKERDRRKKLRSNNNEYRAKIIEQHRAWLGKSGNREKTNKRVRDRRANEPGYREKQNKRVREGLHDGYIKTLICSGTSLRSSDIPTELVVLKRDIVKIKKFMKGIKNEKHQRIEKRVG